MKLKKSASKRTQLRYFSIHFDKDHDCFNVGCKEHKDIHNKKWVNGVLIG